MTNANPLLTRITTTSAKNEPHIFKRPLTARVRKRSPLSRCITSNVPPISRTIYTLKPPARLARSNSMPVIPTRSLYPSSSHSTETSQSIPQTPPKPSRKPLWITMPSSPLSESESHSPERRYLKKFKRSKTLEWACARDRERDSGVRTNSRTKLCRAASESCILDMSIREKEEHPSPRTTSTTSTDDEMEVSTPSGSVVMGLPEIIISSVDDVDMYHSKEETDAAAILMGLRNLVK